MNDMLISALGEVCPTGYDPFEKAFESGGTNHRFSRRHKNNMKEIFKNGASTENAHIKNKRRCGIKPTAALAAGAAVVACLIFVICSGLFPQISQYQKNANKRYDELVCEGEYYLNGDSSAGVYFKVESGSITLYGDRDALIDAYLNDEQMHAVYEKDPAYVNDTVDGYLSGTKFALVKIDGDSYRTDDSGNTVKQELLDYGFVEHVDTLDKPWDSYVFLFNETSLMFDGKDRIRLKPLGDFYLRR